MPKIWQCPSVTHLSVNAYARKAVSPECIGRRKYQKAKVNERQSALLDGAHALRCATLEAGFLLGGQSNGDTPGKSLVGACDDATKLLRRQTRQVRPHGPEFALLADLAERVCFQTNGKSATGVEAALVEQRLNEVRHLIEVSIDVGRAITNTDANELNPLTVRDKLPSILVAHAQLHGDSLAQECCCEKQTQISECREQNAPKVDRDVFALIEELTEANASLNRHLSVWGCPGNVEQENATSAETSLSQSFGPKAHGICTVAAMPGRAERRRHNPLSAREVLEDDAFHLDLQAKSKFAIAFCQKIAHPTNSGHVLSVGEPGTQAEFYLEARYQRPSSCDSVDFLLIPQWRKRVFDGAFAESPGADSELLGEICRKRCGFEESQSGPESGSYCGPLLRPRVESQSQLSKCICHKQCLNRQPTKPACLDESLLDTF
ncbi:MAG: hypothetical protein AAF358_08840 [Pseudomonadota bacterium]